MHVLVTKKRLAAASQCGVLDAIDGFYIMVRSSMVLGTVACWTLLLFPGPILAWIPDPFILQVEHECGDDAVADASATIVTDLEINAKAVCAGGDVPFTNIDSVNLLLPVSYPGQGSSPCVFKQRVGSNVFAVTVIVSFGEPDNPVHEYEEEYTLTCTFDAKATENSSSQGLLDTLIAPIERQQHAGDTATGTSSLLTLTDILGEDYTDVLSIGRVVQLKANSTGDASEVGVRPTACDAVTSSTTYAILRGGCGDGIVFEKDEGFIIDGLVARSPFFEAFSLEGNHHVHFECNFTLCMSDCNGSTCLEEERKRRSVSVSEELSWTDTGPHLKMESQPVRLYRERKRRALTQRQVEEVLQTSRVLHSDSHKIPEL